jgi:dynein heavy chain
MMVPDYALIGEISLMSFGFKREAAGAQDGGHVQALLRAALAQDHYDYGMRAVKSVITAAGNLKRDFPEDDEEVLTAAGFDGRQRAQVLGARPAAVRGYHLDLFPGS